MRGVFFANFAKSNQPAIMIAAYGWNVASPQRLATKLGIPLSREDIAGADDVLNAVRPKEFESWFGRHTFRMRIADHAQAFRSD